MSATGDLGREAARQAAQRELSRHEYRDAQPSLLLRTIGRVLHALGDLLTRGAGVIGNSGLATVLVVALLALLVAAVLVRLGPAGRLRRRTPRALFDAAGPQTAAEHRSAAELAAVQQRWAEAVRERLRAVVRELEARGVLDDRPGRTADEVAAEAGHAVPAVAHDLSRAVTTFDEVWYGGRTADAGSYAAVVAVDQRLSAAVLAAR